MVFDYFHCLYKSSVGRLFQCDFESDDEDEKTRAIVDEEPVAEEGQAGEEDEDLLTAIEISGKPVKKVTKKSKPRRRGRKIRFEGDGTFELDEMAALLSGVDEPLQRVEVLRRLKDNLAMTIDMKKYDNTYRAIPSMWDYCRLTLPREFRGLKPETFLENPEKNNICFLEREILIRVCSMLPPFEFLCLSLTCRFLHWRMFTFCRMRYDPHTVVMEIVDEELAKGMELYRTAPKLTDIDGKRGLFVLQPDCLDRRCFFETLQLKLCLKNYRKVDYDSCLPFILPIRKYFNRLEVIIEIDSGTTSRINDTGSFLEEVQANFWRAWSPKSPDLFRTGYIDSMTTAWLRQDYAHKMDEVWASVRRPFLSRFDADGHLRLRNRVGIFVAPHPHVVARSVIEITTKPTDVEFHAYIHLPLNHPSLARYLRYQREFCNWYSEKYGHSWFGFWRNSSNGRLYILTVMKTETEAAILIGWEKSFSKMECYYRRVCRTVARDPIEDDSDDEEVDEDGPYWEMETALEPEEEEAGQEEGEQRRLG